MERILTEYKITQAILLELPENAETHERLVDTLESCGVRLLILSNLEEKLRHPAIHFEDGNLSFVAPREEQLENPVNRLLKRSLDVVISLPVVVLVLPPLAVGMRIWHRLSSPGPLFFRQVRAGIQNREFEILKFRVCMWTTAIRNGRRPTTAAAFFTAGTCFAAHGWMRYRSSGTS